MFLSSVFFSWTVDGTQISSYRNRQTSRSCARFYLLQCVLSIDFWKILVIRDRAVINSRFSLIQFVRCSAALREQTITAFRKATALRPLNPINGGTGGLELGEGVVLDLHANGAAAKLHPPPSESNSNYRRVRHYSHLRYPFINGFLNIAERASQTFSPFHVEVRVIAVCDVRIVVAQKYNLELHDVV